MTESLSPRAWVVSSTFADQSSARDVAHAVVTARLAACAQIVPGLLSIYSWQGALKEDAEVLLLLKTTVGQRAPLCEQLRALHPYATPQIIATPISAIDDDYLGWLQSMCG